MVSELAESPEVEVAVMASVLRMRLFPHAISAALFLMSACAPATSPYAGAQATSPAVAPASAGAPYAAINLLEQIYFPEASTRGTFTVLGGCVVYRRTGDGRLHTPIFPLGSKITSRGSTYYLEIAGKRHRFGKEVELGGGAIPLAQYRQVQLATMPPGSCPTRYWLVSEVEET